MVMIKFVSPNVEMVSEDTPTKHIERVGRTCYRSEDKIKDGSDVKMLKALKHSGHLSVLEHYYFCFKMGYYSINTLLGELLMCERPYRTEGVRWSYEEDGYFYISLNPRRIIEMYKTAEERSDLKVIMFVRNVVFEIIKKYDTCECLFDGIDPYHTSLVKLVVGDDVPKYHRWHTFCCDTNRGVLAEITRHRNFSFAVESTRYCDYSKTMTFCTTNKDNFDIQYITAIQNEYIRMKENGYNRDVCREILPNLLATKMNVTCFDTYWEEVVLPLRYECVTGKAHPDIVALMGELVKKYGKEIGYKEVN